MHQTTHTIKEEKKKRKIVLPYTNVWIHVEKLNLQQLNTIYIEKIVTDRCFGWKDNRNCHNLKQLRLKGIIINKCFDWRANRNYGWSRGVMDEPEMRWVF